MIVKKDKSIVYGLGGISREKDMYCCPHCGENFNWIIDCCTGKKYSDINFCYKCGTKLEWNEIK